ncbi:MAG: hypothetical protein J6R26_08365 [Paludibacteraceae bacterium]|nr:hypothetical protein [Paludibacteraceae bacterium]
MQTNNTKPERLHFGKGLWNMSEEELVDYIIYTMNRKHLTEYPIGMLPGYLGKTIDTPQGWHLLFWPFLGGYRHDYEWKRVYIENGQLRFELEEKIRKNQYDFEDVFLIEKIFPAPAGETYHDRYYQTIQTNYTVDEFFSMLHHLPIREFEPWSKHSYLAYVASSLEQLNPQREAAEAARRPKLEWETVAKLIDKAPILKVKPMSKITAEFFPTAKQKFARRIKWWLLISLLIGIALGAFMAYHHYELDFVLPIAALVAGGTFLTLLIIDYVDTVL